MPPEDLGGGSGKVPTGSKYKTLCGLIEKKSRRLVAVQPLGGGL